MFEDSWFYSITKLKHVSSDYAAKPSQALYSLVGTLSAGQGFVEGLRLHVGDSVAAEHEVPNRGRK